MHQNRVKTEGLAERETLSKGDLIDGEDEAAVSTIFCGIMDEAGRGCRPEILPEVGAYLDPLLAQGCPRQSSNVATVASLPTTALQGYSLVANLDADTGTASAAGHDTARTRHELHERGSESRGNGAGRAVHDGQSAGLGTNDTWRSAPNPQEVLSC